jgi:hypothetical protein
VREARPLPKGLEFSKTEGSGYIYWMGKGNETSKSGRCGCTVTRIGRSRLGRTGSASIYSILIVGLAREVTFRNRFAWRMDSRDGRRRRRQHCDLQEHESILVRAIASGHTRPHEFLPAGALAGAHLGSGCSVRMKSNGSWEQRCSPARLGCGVLLDEGEGDTARVSSGKGCRRHMVEGSSRVMTRPGGPGR